MKKNDAKLNGRKAGSEVYSSQKEQDFIDTKAAISTARADCVTLAGEVRELTKLKNDADSLVSLAWHRYGLQRLVRERDSDPQEYENLLADLRRDRSPAVVEAMERAGK